MDSDTRVEGLGHYLGHDRLGYWGHDRLGYWDITDSDTRGMTVQGTRGNDGLERARHPIPGGHDQPDTWDVTDSDTRDVTDSEERDFAGSCPEGRNASGNA